MMQATVHDYLPFTSHAGVGKCHEHFALIPIDKWRELDLHHGDTLEITIRKKRDEILD